MEVSQWIMLALHVTVDSSVILDRKGAHTPEPEGGGGKERTIDGANGEAEPTILVSVQNEKDHKVCDGRQDDGCGAQSGSSHEELACNDRVT